MLLVVALSCDEVELKEFVGEVARYGLGYLNPWPFHGDKGAVDPPGLCDLAEFEEVEPVRCI